MKTQTHKTVTLDHAEFVEAVREYIQLHTTGEVIVGKNAGVRLIDKEHAEETKYTVEVKWTE